MVHIPDGLIPVGIDVHCNILTPWSIDYTDVAAKVIKNDNGVLTVHINGANSGTTIEIWERHTREYEMYKNAYIIKEFTKENKTMKFCDLRPGMRIKQRDGSVAVLMPYGDQLLMRVFSNGNTYSMEKYGSDMMYAGKNLISTADIMEVYDIPRYKGIVWSDMFDVGNLTPIWKREEAIEMTVEEIEKALGKKIKIVKEH